MDEKSQEEVKNEIKDILQNLTDKSSVLNIDDDLESEVKSSLDHKNTHDFMKNAT